MGDVAYERGNDEICVIHGTFNTTIFLVIWKYKGKLFPTRTFMNAVGIHNAQWSVFPSVVLTFHLLRIHNSQRSLYLKCLIPSTMVCFETTISNLKVQRGFTTTIIKLNEKSYISKSIINATLINMSLTISFIYLQVLPFHLINYLNI